MKAVQLLIIASLVSVSPAIASEAGDKVDIANQLAREGIYDSALMFYEKALRINPNYMPALEGRANALRHLNHQAERPKKKPKKKEAKKPAEQPLAQKQPKTPSAEAPKEHVAVVPKPTVPTPAPTPAPTPVPTPAPAAKATAPVKSPVKPPVAPAQPPAALPGEIPISTPPQPEAVKPPPVELVKPEPERPPQSIISKPEKVAPAASKPDMFHEQPIGSAAPPLAHRMPAASSSDTTSAQPSGGESVAPPWLVLLAGGTFLTLVVMAVLWLSPSLSASRQLQSRLKGIGKGRGGEEH
jgi:hypothetical protein